MSAAAPVRSVHDALLFECAWEVANKGPSPVRSPKGQTSAAFADRLRVCALPPPSPPIVGGIYTVIKTKAPVTCAE